MPATVPATDATVPPTEGTPPATAGTPEVHVDVAQPVGPYTAGGRGAATVVVSNQGDAPAPWNGGGCRPMAMVRLVTVPREGQPFDDEYWDGARPLHEWLATSTPTFGSDFEGAGTIDYVQWYCAANLTFEFLDAGASEQLDLLVDLRFPHGPLPTFQIEARFPGMQDGTGAVTTTVPVSVVDDPAREPSYDAAVAAMEADPRLEDFMDRTRPAGAMSPCCWYPDLGWWDGAWDLRLFPVWGDGHVLRMRYSPADGSLSVDEPMSADQLPPGS